MDDRGVTHAFRNLLATLPPALATEPESGAEEFAIRRFFKKMEVPQQSRIDERRRLAYGAFLSHDKMLRIPGRDVGPDDPYYGFLPGSWYRARTRIYKWCESFKLGPGVFTSGSESFATRGFNSIESKLMRSKWACSPSCFDLWARLAFRHAAIRRAVRRRFQKAMRGYGLSPTRFNQQSWRDAAGHPERKFICFRNQLEMVTSMTSYHRFSTVPKNNKEDRVIALEPFPHMLVQRAVGAALRSVLLEHTGRDLNHLAAKHREMIRSSSKATIDLSKASDSFHCDLIRFLFPRRIYELLLACRCPQMLGLDGKFVSLNKLSSMGNGYTFDVMSVSLTAIALEHDDDASVFGDDIIVSNEAAPGLIKDLEAAGLTVNQEKTCVNSKFRESCGAVYHDDHGYYLSYDFRYPESLHDCIVVCNKAYHLGTQFPSFRRLHASLLRCVPRALRGPVPIDLTDRWYDGRGSAPEAVDFSSYFWDENPKGGLKVDRSLVEPALAALHLDSEVTRFFRGWVYRPRLASARTKRLLMKRHYGKYAMYLHGGRVTEDVLAGRGIWQPVTYVQVGQRSFRMKALVQGETPKP